MTNENKAFLGRPLFWQGREAVPVPFFYNQELLDTRIKEIDRFATREKIKVKYVSGLIVTRINSKTGKNEVLLVKGSSKGVPKEFWQFPGGHVLPGENHVVALHRELREELGVEVPETILYVKTYVPKIKPDVKEIYAIHAFMTSDHDWDAHNVEKGSDVSEMEWTDNPLVHTNGEARILTEQVDYMLRRFLGYTGPANKNTCPDKKYHGDPTI